MEKTPTLLSQARKLIICGLLLVVLTLVVGAPASAHNPGPGTGNRTLPGVTVAIANQTQIKMQLSSLKLVHATWTYLPNTVIQSNSVCWFGNNKSNAAWISGEVVYLVQVKSRISYLRLYWYYDQFSAPVLQYQVKGSSLPFRVVIINPTYESQMFILPVVLS